MLRVQRRDDFWLRGGKLKRESFSRKGLPDLILE